MGPEKKGWHTELDTDDSSLVRPDLWAESKAVEVIVLPGKDEDETQMVSLAFVRIRLRFFNSRYFNRIKKVLS